MYFRCWFYWKYDLTEICENLRHIFANMRCFVSWHYAYQYSSRTFKVYDTTFKTVFAIGIALVLISTKTFFCVPMVVPYWRFTHQVWRVVPSQERIGFLSKYYFLTVIWHIWRKLRQNENFPDLPPWVISDIPFCHITKGDQKETQTESEISFLAVDHVVFNVPAWRHHLIYRFIPAQPLMNFLKSMYFWWENKCKCI